MVVEWSRKTEKNMNKQESKMKSGFQRSEREKKTLIDNLCKNKIIV
jgi:hypothetical protein